MRLYRTRTAVAMVVALAAASSGCASRWAYRQGQVEARKGNWDAAVARLTKAVQKDPDNVGYKIALENARVQASRFHGQAADKHLAAEELEKAVEELEIAANYDPGNRTASDELQSVRDRIRKRDEEKERLADYEAVKARAKAQARPAPLSPRSSVPLTLKFTDTSLEKVFESMGKLAGVNVVMDPDFRDKRVNVNVSNVTFEEALDQLTLVHHLFYKVLDQNTIIIVPESPQKRRTYDDVVVRTFYLQNADVDETLGVVRNLTGLTKIAASKTLGAITIMGTADKLALAEKIIESNDKAKGEVLVEVRILEVNRDRIKQYGIELSNYSASVTFDPTGAAAAPAAGFTSVRAQFLSSLNLSDFVVNIPNNLLTSFLQTDDTVRLLAAPKLRAAEGKKTTLKIVNKVPVPSTTINFANNPNQPNVPVTQITYADVGVTMELTPKVSAGGEITLELSTEFSLQQGERNVGSVANPALVPVFSTRAINGILRVRDGQTSMIGGLVQGNDAANLRGVLGLENIPVLGKLFSSNKKEKQESEIVISITPHLLRAPKITEEDLRSLYTGTEEVVRVPGARGPLFGTPEPAPAAGPSPSPAASPSPATPPGRPPGPSNLGAPGGTGVPPSSLPPPASGPLAPLPTPTPEPGEGTPPPEAAPSPSPSPSPLAQPMVSRWTPPQITLKRGESGALTLSLIGAHNVLAVDLVLTFDPATLEVSDIAPGGLLSLDGAPIQIDRQVEFGKVRAKFTRPAGTTGSGAIVVLTLKALQPGLGVVTVDAVSVTTTTGPESPLAPTPGRVLVTP